MFNISDYFKKFAKIEGDTMAENDAILAALAETCGTGTVRYDIRKNIIYLKGSPLVKSMVFTRKARILALIKEKLPTTKIVDIR
ncbi:MAG TPA: hypothetical protein VGE35_00090 [Candidatus Paceibacterota bacterium]